MGRIIWSFKIGDFQVTCEEADASHIDPWAYSQEQYELLCTLMDNDRFEVSNITAYVTQLSSGDRIGRGVSRNNIRVALDPSDSVDYQCGADGAVGFADVLKEYRANQRKQCWEAVRKAIGEARAL